MDSVFLSSATYIYSLKVLQSIQLFNYYSTVELNEPINLIRTQMKTTSTNNLTLISSYLRL